MAFWDEILTTPLRVRWSPERFARHRDRRLRALVEHAWRTMPFYRDLLDRHGVRPRHVRGLGDVTRLPVVTRDALREAGPAAHARDVPAHLAHWTSTSGSSGNPLIVLSRLRDQARWQAQNHHTMWRNGWRPWHDAVTLGAQGPLFRNPVGRWRVARWTWIDPARPVSEWIEEIARRRPGTLAAYPSALRELCLELRARGEPHWRPGALLTGGEQREAGVDDLALEVLGRRPRDQYGAVECGRIAFECSAHRGHHVRLDGVHVEILRDGRPVGPDETGEVHITSLLIPTMPFIRYRIGDLARWVGEGPCACGLWWPRLGLDEGRGCDILDLPDGRRVPITTLAGPVGASPHVRAYQFVRTGPTDLVLRVLPLRLPDGSIGRAADRIRERLPGVGLTVEIVRTLPRTRTGKIRRYVDETVTSHSGA
jgi:phenylacetate-coenzyme A ligase PaaK-like adenylate-forming protein